MHPCLKSMRFYEGEAGGGGTALVPTPIPPGTPAPTPTPSGTSGHWSATYEGIPDAIRTSPALQPFKTPADAIKAYVDVQPMLGADKIPVPKDWNDKTQVAAFNSKLGVPEKAEGYKLAEVLTPKLPAGTKLDEKLVGTFQSVALEAGLSPRQAAAAATAFMLQTHSEQAAARQTREVESANALNAFKKERGSAFDTDIAMGKKFLINYASPELLEHIRTSGLGNMPEFIKMVAKAGLGLREDTMNPSGMPGALQGDEAQQAQVRLAEMKGDENFMKALNNAGHPKHRDAVAEWSKINGLIPVKRGISK